MVSEEDIKILEKMINEIIEKDDCNLFETLSPLEIALKIKKLLQGYKELKENSIPKSLVEEAKQKIEKARDLASELIEHKVVIADSDSLYSGERIAHDYDLSLLEELLKGDK